MNTQRRRLVTALSAGAGLMAIPPALRAQSAPRVVVIGGGFGGATAAKYLALWGGDIEVVLIERSSEFVSCPISNLVLGGHRRLADVTRSYSGLTKRGVHVINDAVDAVDPAKRSVSLAGGGRLSYDRLIVSPGVDFLSDAIPGLYKAGAADRLFHAWKAGPQTVALRAQLEALDDGGVFALAIPKAPYRCPPGPYERACQVASYFKLAKPRSKVLILDANEDIVSKKALFAKAFKERYDGIIEYRPNSTVVDVDHRTNTLQLEFDTVSADLLNVIPPQKAGRIAETAGLITANNRWCGVHWQSMESVAQAGIHVLGDATLAAPAMPKSGHMANQHGKVCAAAVIDLLAGRAINADPLMVNTCYSFVDGREVIHVSSVHRFDAEKKTMQAVKDSGGVSAMASELEGQYAWSWAHNIWNDMLT